MNVDIEHVTWCQKCWTDLQQEQNNRHKMSGDELEPGSTELVPQVEAHTVELAAVTGAVLVQATEPMPGPLRRKGALSQDWRVAVSLKFL